MSTFSAQSITLIAVVSAVGACMFAWYAVEDALGQAMNSSSYSIQSDSLNFGGGLTDSGSYSLQSTGGEVSTGYSSSTSYSLHAGFQQSGDVYIATTPASDVTMSPAIGGVSGGTSNGSTSFTVTTDNAAGYSVTLKASSSPALVSADGSFADYAPASSDPDFSFSVAAVASAFGFSPEGADIAARFKDNGSACGVGSGSTADACWDGLSTSPKTVVQRLSSNQPSGTLTTLKFRAASGSAHIQPSGTYTATTTLTILPL